MGLPFGLPGYVQEPKNAFNRSLRIRAYGLDTEGLGGILIDDKFWLEGHEASEDFYLIPKIPNEEIPYTTAMFYADCIAYEHEIPALAFPLSESVPSTAVPWLLRKKSADIGSIFIDALDGAFEAASLATNGRWIRAIFRYDPLEHPTEQLGDYHIVRVDFEEKYTQKSQGLHLYNAALRQADPLSRYLNYYRIIEWTTGNNGKSWIEETLKEKTLEYDGAIWCYRRSLPWKRELIPGEIRGWIRSDRLGKKKDRVNILEVMRGYALSRLEELSGSMTHKKIAEILYNENRCGIAHGGRIKLHDIGNDFIHIINDLKLLRYLSRIAIHRFNRQ